MYGGLGLLFFFLILFLQQVAGYSALEAGTATLPVSIVMFFLSARFGALADRFGPRWFMGGGPLVSALGLALFARLDQDVNYLTDLLPAMLLFALGPVDDRGPAHRHRAGRRRRAQRRRGLRREQRDRPRGGPGGGGGGGRGDRRAVRLGARRAAGPAGRPPRAGGPARGGQAPAAGRDPGAGPAAGGARPGGRGHRRGVGQRLPLRHGNRGRPGGRRRAAGPDRAAQPAARGQVRRLPRRRARWRASGCRAGEAPAAGEASGEPTSATR